MTAAEEAAKEIARGRGLCGAGRGVRDDELSLRNAARNLDHGVVR